MSQVKVVAGDIPNGTYDIRKESFGRGMKMTSGLFGSGTQVDLMKDIDHVDIMTEEKSKKFFGSAAAGVAGGLVLGPVGFIAGVLAGGNKNDVTFACYLKDGRKFMATTNRKTFTSFQAATF